MNQENRNRNRKPKQEQKPKKEFQFHRKDKKIADLYPKELHEKLEFDKIIEIVEGLCSSTLGREQLKKMRFLTNIDTINRHLEQVKEYRDILLSEADDYIPETNYLDLSKEIAILQVEGAVLTSEQLYRIYQVFSVINQILRFFDKETDEGENKALYPELFKITGRVEIDGGLLNQIKLVIDDEGKIRSSASRELVSIRKLIGIKYQEIDSKFKAAMRHYKLQGILTDDAESVRDGRRVLSVQASYKRRVNGIIIDESASGRTTFIEPAETIQVYNDLFALQQEERREIYKILKDLTAQIRPFAEHVEAYQMLLAQLDFIRAKAKFALKIDANKPVLCKERIIELDTAYHPLLLYMNKKQNKPTVPMNLRLSNSGRILVISGPNAGGKSVSLKTVGVLQLMLQSGMLIPVEEQSQMSVFNKIFVDIGDEQSLENDLSTYSSHLLNMKYFLDFADAKTLILIDEFGSGTDPKFGGAIAEAVLEKLNQKFVFGVITTHYSNIKIFASNTSGILNGTLLFDIKRLQPKYQLEVGRAGSSFAFEIARKIGVDEAVLEGAKTKIGDDYQDFDRLLSSLHVEKVELEELSANLKGKEKKLERLLNEYESKAKEIKKKQKTVLLDAKKAAAESNRQHKQKLEKMLQDWQSEKENKAALKNIKEELAAEKKQFANEIEHLRDEVFQRESVGQLKEGATVQLREGSEQKGTVIELRKNQAVVQFGEMRTAVKLKELVVVNAQKKRPNRSVKFDMIEAKMSFENTLDVRGMRREEAILSVENMLDKAIMSGATVLKIIHGKGDGILRRSIRKSLQGYRAISAVRSEEPEYGGDGISIVELS